MQAAFIGLGNMGRGMAANLVAAGIPTTVYDVRPAAVAELVAAGASAARTSPQAAEGADVVCVAVFDEEQVREVVVGTADGGGVLGTAKEGAVVAIHSTVSPAFVRELGAAAARRGVAVIDVAMTGGGDTAAAAGALTFMVGGTAEAVGKAAPALDAMARRVFHLGPVGAGVSAKIVSNFLATSNVALVREALRIAAGVGLGEEILAVVEDGGVGSSWVSNHWADIRRQEEDYTTGREGMVAMWSKDLQLARGLAAEGGVAAPIAAFIVERIVPEVGANGLTGRP